MHTSRQPRLMRRRDEGAVLPLVLVMMVISTMIVIPLLGYAVAVLKANTVVSSKTRNSEATEAGARVALLDPEALFNTCKGPRVGVPEPPPLAPTDGDDVIDGDEVVAGLDVVECELLDEKGPLDALQLQIPDGAVATQLGHPVPTSFAGTLVDAGAGPYPTEDWWAPTARSTATAGEIWLPHLPARPSVDRDPDPFRMPSAFDCTVFLPGSYDEPVTVSDGNVYFASGVYYFEQPVTFEGNANVVVGYGLAELPTECSDDFQVADNLVDDPGVLGITGVGATFVFGADGRLVVDDSETDRKLSVRFNQRYAPRDENGVEDASGGGRISIISVNGDDSSPGPHVVGQVASVPRSLAMVAGTPVPVDADATATPDSRDNYRPSSSRFTAEARPPATPANLVVEPRLVEGVDPSITGAALITWDEVVGQAAGGALIDGYDVLVSGLPNAACDRSRIVPITLDPAIAPRRLGCLATGLTLDATYEVSVSAFNRAGSSAVASTASVAPSASDTVVAAPAPPVVGGVTPRAGAAEITWTPVADPSGAPITKYTVNAYRVYDGNLPSDPPADPPLLPTEVLEPPRSCETVATFLRPAPTSCVIGRLVGDPSSVPLPDLGLDGPFGVRNLAYRFTVTATNSVGMSAEVPLDLPPVVEWRGDDAFSPTTPERVVVPWVPEPIVDIRAGDDDTEVSVPGYVSVPMGRVRVQNEGGRDVRVNGGALAGTFDVVDSRGATGTAGSVPIGFANDIVLQRRIRLIATAGNTTARVVVQINENLDYAINSWVVQQS